MDINVPVLIIGIIFTLAGLLMIFKAISKKLRCTEVINAKIKGINEKLSSSSHEYNRISYFPVFEYYYNGYNYVKEYDIGGSSCKYKIGDDVEIKIDPNKPEDFILKGGSGPILFALVFVLIGIFVDLIGLGIIFK